MNKEQSKENSKKNKKQIKKEEKKQIKQAKKEKRKKSKAWKRFRVVLIIASILILIFIGKFIYRMAKNGWGLQGFLAAAVGHDENTLKDLDELTFLALGISGVDEDYKLADTIMVCRYNPKTQNASILSIPRDTYVGKDTEKASASYKINAVYRNGENIEGMLDTIEELLELEIDNYVVIDTDALIQLVDAIGGVEFDVPIDMQYDDPTQDLHISLKAGYQKLNGEQAEGLVRFRHNNDGTTYPLEYGDNDIGRMRTQREFISETLKQTMKPENLLHITKIAQIGFNSIQTNMKWDFVKDYLPYAVNFKTDNLQTGAVPGTPELKNGIWIYTADTKKTAKLVEDLFVEKQPEEENENIDTNTISDNTIANTTKNTTSSQSIEEPIKIELLNGTGNEEKLLKAEKALTEKGYNVIKKGNTDTVKKTSIINRTRQSTTITKKLKQTIKVGTTSQRSNNSGVDFTIILGKDYK